jgi:uncharacterized protein YbcI
VIGWACCAASRVAKMSNVPARPDPPLEVKGGVSLSTTISREMVRMMKRYYGRGPTRAKSYLVDDLLIVVLRGGTLSSERTMLEAGFSDAVREFRQKFENLMAERLIGAIEQLTERKVVTYQSQVLFDPDMVVEIFVFDKALERSAIEETARALLSDDDDETVTAEDEAAAGAAKA